MKELICVLFIVSCSHFLSSQLNLIKYQVPKVIYTSKFIDDSLVFNVGEKLLFEQNCTDKTEKFIVNGVVTLENNYIKTIKFNTSVFFKDTVIVKLIYKSKEKDLNKIIGLFTKEEIIFTKIDKNYSTFSFEKNGIKYLFEKRKKELTIILI